MTPRTRLAESISMILDRLSDEDRDLAKKVIGWELEHSPVPLSLVLSVENWEQ